MAIITRRITNNLDYLFTIPCPGEIGQQNANLIIPASVVDLDLLTLCTEDSLWTLQSQLLSLVRAGAITVTGTMDTSSFDYDGVASLHADSSPDIRGDIKLISGTGITLSQTGQNITVTASATPITTGNLTDTGTDGITVTGGTGAVIGSGTSLSQHVADSTHSGYLSSTDYSTFSGTATTVSNATDADTVSTIVKRDGSGNFSAGTITASLTGHASLDLPLTGGTLSGNLSLSNASSIEYFSILGKSADTSTDTGGVAVYLGHNSVNNRQLIFADTAAEGTASENGIVILVGNGYPHLYGATADASAATKLILGSADSNTEIIGPLGVMADPVASAVLQADSTTKGFLPPRMTTAQRDSIGTKATGTVTVVSYTSLSGAVLTINGTVLTEGVDWTASISNASTATSLASAITTATATTLCTAVAVGAAVHITANAVVGGNAITLATSDVVNLTLSGSKLAGEVDPVEGLEIYNTTTHRVDVFDGTLWQEVAWISDLPH